MDSDNDDTLTKPKTKRSQKQTEAFEKARQARQAYLNEQKIKEEETKKKRDTLKEIKNELNGKPKAENSRGKPKIKEEPIVENKYASSKGKRKEPIYESDSDSVDESEEEVVEEEIIIMKKPKKKKPVKKVIRKVIMQESSDEEEEDGYEPEPPPKPAPTTRSTKTQQNARSKIVANPVQSVMGQYYFMD
jgi:hypothetical protein